jgi:hypothetical protein
VEGGRRKEEGGRRKARPPKKQRNAFAHSRASQEREERGYGEGEVGRPRSGDPAGLRSSRGRFS